MKRIEGGFVVKRKKASERLSRVAAGTVAALTAVSLAVLPVGGVLFPQVAGADEGASAPEPALQREAWSDGYDAQEVLRAARACDVKGVPELERYLAGEDLTAEELLSIDADALLLVDFSLGRELLDLQEEAALALDASQDDDAAGGLAEPDSGSSGSAGGSAAEGSAGELGAPDGVDAVAGDASDEAGESGSASDVPDVVLGLVDVTGEQISVPEPSPVVGTGSADPGSYVAADEVYPQWSYEGDATYVPHNVNVSLTTEKFIALIGEQARAIAQENDLYASVMIAQAVLESGSGNSVLAKAPNNNLFGIKGSYEGQSVRMGTAEDMGDGSYAYVRASFRVYPSVRESLLDYADLLVNGLGGYYAPAWKSNAETYVEACAYLEGRYATDTAYAEKLQDLIVAYDLARYDEPLDYELVDTYEVPVLDEETGAVVVDPDTGEAVTEQRDLLDLMRELTSHLGEDYVWGGAAPGGFDCSGLVQYCYREAMGVDLPRTTFFQCLQGEDADFDDLHMGDLLFFVKDGLAGHVAVYLGEGCYIEAPKPGDVVKVTSMSEKMPTFAKRVLPTQDVISEPAIDAEAAQTAAYRACVAASNVAKRFANMLTSLAFEK